MQPQLDRGRTDSSPDVEIRWFEFSFSVGQNGMVTVWKWMVLQLVHLVRVHGVYTCTNRIYLKLLIMRNPFTYLISSLFVGQLEVVVFLEYQIPKKIPLSFHCIHSPHSTQIFSLSTLKITPDVRYASSPQLLKASWMRWKTNRESPLPKIEFEGILFSKIAWCNCISTNIRSTEMKVAIL